MNETGKATARRMREDADGIFPWRSSLFPWRNIFKGRGIDVGAGDDPLGMDGCVPFDKEDGDAQFLSRYFPAESQSYIHSSQCLEHLPDAAAAIRDWLTLLVPGGYLIATVPSWELYEYMRWPSATNADHRSTWSLWQKGSPAPTHCKLPEWLDQFGCEILACRLIDTNYNYQLGMLTKDQTWIEKDGVECFLEFVLRR